MVAKDQIIEFMRIAHANSWPEGIGPLTKPGLYGFEETIYSHEKWEFYDLFGGKVTDIGFEVIFFEKAPVWGAAYRGGVISTAIDLVEIFNFLIIALNAGHNTEFPVRGPSVFHTEDKKWLYLCQISGDFDSFVGAEKIFFRNEIVYERGLLGGSFGSGLYGAPIPLFSSVFMRKENLDKNENI